MTPDPHQPRPHQPAHAETDTIVEAARHSRALPRRIAARDAPG